MACRPEFVEQADAEDGILFFINADVKGDALSIIDLNARLPKQAPAGTDLAAESPKVAEDLSVPIVVPEWEPKFLPAQVRVVQLLSDLETPLDRHG